MRWIAVACGLAAGCGRFGFPVEHATGDAAAPDALDAAGDGGMPDAAPLPNYVFVASTNQDVCATSIAGADAVCKARAIAGGLPGTYLAWYSSPTVNARDRFGSARGWIRRDGLPFGDTMVEIVAGGVDYPARLDEFGTDLGFATTQTATTSAGAYDSVNGCKVGGLALYGGTNWGSGFVVPPSHVLCFGVDRAVPVTVAPPTNRIAFVSTALFLPASGIAAADQLCMNEAKVPGTFRAFLPTTAVSAASRFDLTKSPWQRPDGVAIVAVAGDLATWNTIAATDVLANGKYSGGGSVWTGDQVKVPTFASTCNDWTSATPMGRTTEGDVSQQYGGGFNLSCGSAHAVFCLQL